MKKLLLGILVITLFSIFYFTFTSSEKSEEELIEESLSLLYRVEDANEIDNLMNPTELSKVQNKYQEIFSEKGLKKLKSDRPHSLYREAAKNGQFTIKIQNIETERLWINEKDDSILNKYERYGYEYKVELYIEYIKSGESETIYEEGYINLVEIDGKWKVDLLIYKNLNEVFMKNLYVKK